MVKKKKTGKSDSFTVATLGKETEVSIDPSNPSFGPLTFHIHHLGS